MEEQPDARDRTAPTLDDLVTLREAYQIMWVFAVNYWDRGQRQDDMIAFIADTGPALQDQTADLAQIQDWLDAASQVRGEAGTAKPWGTEFGERYAGSD